ncbi:MAG: tetratricopeptide repeat protein [Pyrinomonadaceae bacterium]
MKYWLFLLAAILLLTATPERTAAQNSWLSDAERARFETLRRSGLDALYDLDYEKARREFGEIARLFPNHPAGSQLLAARLWVKTLYESRRLQTSLYSSDSFYTRGDDKVDPKIVAEFRALTRESKRLAEARLKVNPKDVEAFEFLGATAGLKASFEEAVERRHFAAIKDGSEAVDRYRDVLKIDPNYVDAQLPIGLYDYVVGALPLPQKILAGIAGYRGSKKRGLAALERVAKEGRWSNDDAKSLLILLYSREQRFADALAVARELSAKYPRNYLFRLETADALVSYASQQRKAGNQTGAAQAEQEAFKTFDDLLRDRTVKETVSKALDLVHFKYGEVLLTAGQGERAAAEFIAVIKVDGAEPTLVTMSHLYAARALDLAGKRNDAMSHYRQVLSRPDIFDAHDGAKKGLREPYRTEVRQASNSAPRSNAREQER